MCWYVTLDTRICVDLPGPANVIVGFKNDMVNELLQFRMFMLDLMCEYQARESGSYSSDAQASIFVGHLVQHGDAYFFKAVG